LGAQSTSRAGRGRRPDFAQGRKILVSLVGEISGRGGFGEEKNGEEKGEITALDLRGGGYICCKRRRKDPLEMQKETVSSLIQADPWILEKREKKEG